jgi:hypothetical protein
MEVERPLILGWSGLTLYKQHVRYKVEAVLKGKFFEVEVWVGHPIYYRSLQADKDVPQLSPKVFKTNSVHIVFMKHVKELNPPPFTGPPLNPSAKPTDRNALRPRQGEPGTERGQLSTVRG